MLDIGITDLEWIIIIISLIGFFYNIGKYVGMSITIDFFLK